MEGAVADIQAILAGAPLNRLPPALGAQAPDVHGKIMTPHLLARVAWKAGFLQESDVTVGSIVKKSLSAVAASWKPLTHTTADETPAPSSHGCCCKAPAPPPPPAAAAAGGRQFLLFCLGVTAVLSVSHSCRYTQGAFLHGCSWARSLI